MALRQVSRLPVFGSLRLVAGSSTRGDWSALSVLSARTYATVDSSCKYAKSHEWVRIDGDVATIGISDFAQSELGDVVYVELPDVGTAVDKGSTFGVVESVKAASDVYAPISGEVVEKNDAVVAEPVKVNSAPFAEGWLIKVKPSNAADLSELMDAAAYEKHCEH